MEVLKQAELSGDVIICTPINDHLTINKNSNNEMASISA